jgi:hypothetical protein
VRFTRTVYVSASILHSCKPEDPGASRAELARPYLRSGCGSRPTSGVVGAAAASSSSNAHATSALPRGAAVAWRSCAAATCTRPRASRRQLRVSADCRSPSSRRLESHRWSPARSSRPQQLARRGVTHTTCSHLLDRMRRTAAYWARSLRCRRRWLGAVGRAAALPSVALRCQCGIVDMHPWHCA